MRKFWLFTLAIAALTLTVWGDDWPMPGGNPQRNGWAKSEHLIDKSNVKTLALLFKYQTDNLSKGLNSLTAPVVNGNLITYRGFKEMLIFGGSADTVFSVDADLNALLWETHLPYVADKPARGSSTADCPGGLTASVVMAGSSSASMHFAALASRAPAAAGIRPVRPSHYLPPLSQSVYPLTPTTLTQLNALYTVSSDGYLHVLNSSTGQDLIPAVRFVPPNAKVTSLNIRDNVVYATTADNCDGYQDALFAIDILSPQKTVTSFVPRAGGFSGTAGTAIGSDGTIYVQTVYAPGDRPGQYRDTVLALTPKDLKVKDYFTLPGKPISREASETPGISPVVFSYIGRDAVVAGGRNGRLYLLDSKMLGGADHQTPLFESAPVARTGKKYRGGGFRGAFSTWLDVETGRRWFYAPASGHILAFQIGGKIGEPTLETAWTSSDMQSPAPVVIANGMLFTLAKEPATLHVLDAASGKELYSSAQTIPRSAASAQLAVANGRVYFTAQDNAVYCFGIPGQQRQLVEQ